MTKIKKLEMKGFKSFGKKTVIPFEDGYNCILGPNGSGKSNIIDALCFVLGKMGSKSLRAEKTANLIYNGGENKQAASQGEVSLYFDNSEKELNDEDDVVKITRKIDKDGTGTYLINDEKSTRTNIVNMLSRAKINPDGYNIILQGDINKLVEMSGTERREIIEEIAGIDIYEEKKKKAERELDRVEEKINEADIILGEKKTHLEELKEDKEKAQRFKDLDNKLKKNKATILSRKIEAHKEEKNEKEEDIEEIDEEIDELEEENNEKREVIEEKKEKIEELNEEVEEKGEDKQVEVHQEIEQLKVDIAVKREKLTGYKQELEKIENRREELEENVEELESKLEIHEKEKETRRDIATDQRKRKRKDREGDPREER